jgi:hypothetical protein
LDETTVAVQETLSGIANTTFGASRPQFPSVTYPGTQILFRTQREMKTSPAKNSLGTIQVGRGAAGSLIDNK